MSFSLFAVVAVAVSLATRAFVVADAPPSLPAWDAFKKANDAIKDYTETVTAHEVKDGHVQDRVYHFSYAKPSFARSEVVSGPGSGGVAVWQGGDHIRGHQGGLFSGIKLTLSITDGRAVDIRGKTLVAAFFPAMIAGFEAGGKLSEAPGQTIGGVATDDVTLVPTDPSKERNLTKETIVLSRVTHLPLEHLGYEGTQLVEDERFTDQKIDPGLPPSTFEM